MLTSTCRFIWPSGFRGEEYLEINQSETRMACGGHFLSTHRDEMSKVYKGSAIDVSYQVSIHLAKRCQRRFKKNGQSETRIAYGGHVCWWIGTKWAGHSIDASYQLSLHLAEQFQRRRLKCEKLTDDGRQMTDDGSQVMAKAHIAFGKAS